MNAAASLGAQPEIVFLNPESAIFIGLFNNLAIAIVLVAVYATVIGRLRRYPPQIGRLALGVSFGVFTIACMHAKIPVVEGVIVDQRNALVTLAGVFGGPLAAVVSGAIASLYRAHLGGAGVLSGVTGCALAAFAGAVLPRFLGRMETFARAAMLALVATLIIQLGWLAFGGVAYGWELLKAVVLPFGTAIFLGILLIGLLLAREERRLHAETALRGALHEAQTANRHKSIFLAAMSHELRTPLNAIMGFSEIIRDQHLGPLPPKYKEYASDIHNSGRELLALISDILDVTSIEVGKRPIRKEAVSLSEVVRECVKGAALSGAKRGIAVAAEIAEPAPMLHADRRAVYQMVQNLLDNALKFTGSGGRITLTTVRRQGEVAIRVTDTGIGIGKEDIIRVTEPFARGASDPYVTNDGVGLGLAIVKSLVEAHDGHLEIASERGKGTAVEVTLPGATSPPSEADARCASTLVRA